MTSNRQVRLPDPKLVDRQARRGRMDRLDGRARARLLDAPPMILLPDVATPLLRFNHK
jgi:hypothetical protein